MTKVKNIPNTSKDKPDNNNWSEGLYYALKDRGEKITRADIKGKDGAHVKPIEGEYKNKPCIGLTTPKKNNANNKSIYSIPNKYIVPKSEVLRAIKKHCK